MVESLREKVVNILHTKDGSRVALHCVWHGSTRVRYPPTPPSLLFPHKIFYSAVGITRVENYVGA